MNILIIDYVMKTLMIRVLITLLLFVLNCAAPPKGKIDRLYAGLSEYLPRLDPFILSGRSILLDPGHGGYFPGTFGQDSLDEASVNLGVALYLGGLLREAGATVHFTRSADRDFLTMDDSTLASDLQRRVEITDSLQPDIFVSIHHNASPSRDGEANAIETYYRFGDPASRDLAFAVHRHLIRNLGIMKGEVRQGNYYILRNIDIPAILGEASYLSNPGVESQLRFSKKQQLEAEAYFLGILDYFHRGTPKLTAVFPPETLLTYIPSVVFVADDIGGLGIDPDAVFMTINERRVRSYFHPGGGRITHTLPWNTPNGHYTASLHVRNVMGNSSRNARIDFDISLPAETAVFESAPGYFPPSGGTGRMRVLLLDRRGMKVADGTIAEIKIGQAKGAFIGSTIDGFVEFPFSLSKQDDSLEIAVVSRGKRFSKTVTKLAADAGEAYAQTVILNHATGVPLANATIWMADTLVEGGTASGVYFTPILPGRSIHISAPGYRPLSTEWPLSDSLSLDPWYDGILHNKRFVLHPGGGSTGESSIGKLGLSASHVSLQAATYLAAYLSAAGASVRFTRENEQFPTHQDIVAITNGFRADRYIELRHSHSPHPSLPTDPASIKTYFFPGSRAGKEMAETVASRVALASEAPASYTGEMVTYPLQQTACPAIIVEAPAVTSEEEEQKLSEAWYVRRQAYAIFLGILEHFGVSIEGEVAVRLKADPGQRANHLITLDDTWNLLTSPDGEVRFHAVDEGMHTISTREGREVTITVEKGEIKRVILSSPDPAP